MSPTIVAVADKNAGPYPLGIQPSSPHPPSPSPPQTDYLSMDQNELLKQNIAETRKRMHQQSLFAELFDFAKKRHWKKKVLTLVIISSSACVFIDLIFFDHIRKFLIAFLQWMAVHTALAGLTFIAIFVISTRKYLYISHTSCVCVFCGMRVLWTMSCVASESLVDHVWRAREFSI
jgi:hypothetical protein